MKANEINIRDPFVLYDNQKYYMYGTRADGFGKHTCGFDVYISDDLKEWSEPIECFNSEKYNLDREVNWAPEVYKYGGSYIMLATFTRENGLRGTYALKADSPKGSFSPYSDGALTPEDWECLDGTLYIDKNGEPYLVFCHEHTQIEDGTICTIKLNKDLRSAKGNARVLFCGSSFPQADKKEAGKHFITDGPFMYRTKDDELMMIWSTIVKGKYYQCIAKSDNKEIDGIFIHLPPMITDDGGHGMIFKFKEKLMLTYHSPNKSGSEKPRFTEITDEGNRLIIKP